VSGSSPPERLALGVVCGDKVINALHKLRDAGEGSAPDGLVGYQGKKSLHLIEPGTVGGNEVHVPTWPGRQPSLDLGVTVGGVVVDNAVDIKLAGHSLVNLSQKLHKLLMPMA